MNMDTTTAMNITIGTGTADEFFERSKVRAERLDRGEKLPADFRITFEDPADLLRVLSTERLRLLKTRNEANPGHGAMTVVEPLAQRYHLEATV